MITDTLKSLYTIADAIYGQVKLVRANQAQCKTLADRVAIVIKVVKNLDGVKDGDHYLPGLTALQSCLTECNLFIQQFVQSQSWFKQVLKAGTAKERFAELNEKLNKGIQHLNLGLSAQAIINREQDKTDELADSTYLRQNMEMIIKLGQEHTEKLQHVEVKLEEHHVIQVQQYASIRGHLVALLEAKHEKDKPPIDPHLVVPFHELVFKTKLAEGSFGKIFLSEWLEQEVAVKALGGGYKADDLVQLIREIKIMGRLRHKHIVQLVGACINTEYPCLVMDYMEGGSLEKVVKEVKFSPLQKKQLALEIAKGLYYLHSRGIVHRDLRSANVLLDANGVAKITDFGLSKGKTASIAAVKGSSGNVAWQAPECLMRIDAASTHSDIYSFGVVLWEICTGKTPFADAKGGVSVKRICAGERETIPKEIPEVFRSIIEACWRTNPLERPALFDVIRQLKAYELSPEELYNEGCDLEKAGKLREARECYEKSASKGFYKAETNLGFFNLKGMGGLKVDKKEAYGRFFKAAQQGHPRAMHNVASLLEQGEGVSKSLPDALTWYQKASAAGDASATVKSEKLRSMITAVSFTN